ncbi:hypothetical protein TPA0909_57270 [Streptomyces albus]|nr:hypothetical protein TPA0909_57270 [Streptomyces albus]
MRLGGRGAGTAISAGDRMGPAGSGARCRADGRSATRVWRDRQFLVGQVGDRALRYARVEGLRGVLVR